MIGRGKLAFATALLAGCGEIPRDPEGTLERVKRERRFAVGVVEGQVGSAASHVVARIARDAGARPAPSRDQLEPLLLRLEAGSLDLVVGGRFDAKSPWAHRVTLGPPLGNKGAPVREHVVTRNGENAWIMLVQRATEAGS